MTARRCDRCGGSGSHLCAPRALHVVDFFGEVLVHTKGRYSRRPFVLAPWQRDDIITPIFGRQEYSTEHGQWVRTIRSAWIETAKKNGKSELLAGIALTLLCADDEEGAEVYGCACDREQARKVFDVAERMVELSPTLSKRIKIYKQAKRLVYERTGSFYEIVAADAAGNFGHNPHGVVFDEVITQPSRELWDAFEQAEATRAQMLMVAATTAGNDPNSFAATEHKLCERIAKSPKLDRRRHVYMRNMPEAADPFDEKNWKHANPALGDFKSLTAMRDLARKAKLSPAREEAFRQFQCNQWRRQFSRFVSLESWDASAGSVREERLRGAQCYGGLDLASTTDIAALAWDFPPAADLEGGVHRVLWRFWLPEARLEDLDRRTAGEAALWVKRKWLTLTPGNVIDYEGEILPTIDRDAQSFDVAELAFDRWGATQITQQLTDRGMTVVPIGQGFASMSPPTKEYERTVLERRYHHGGNPVMRWMMSHAVVRRDAAGNIKPDKERSADKIDGFVAGVMALDRAIRHTAKKRSSYEEGDLRVG